jgi:hypothetical protein
MSAAGHHLNLLQRRHEGLEIREKLIRARKGDNQLAVAGHVRRGDRDDRAGESAPELTGCMSLRMPHTHPPRNRELRKTAGDLPHARPGPRRRSRPGRE